MDSYETHNERLKKQLEEYQFKSQSASTLTRPGVEVRGISAVKRVGIKFRIVCRDNHPNIASRPGCHCVVHAISGPQWAPKLFIVMNQQTWVHRYFVDQNSGCTHNSRGLQLSGASIQPNCNSAVRVKWLTASRMFTSINCLSRNGLLLATRVVLSTLRRWRVGSNGSGIELQEPSLRPPGLGDALEDDVDAAGAHSPSAH